MREVTDVDSFEKIYLALRKKEQRLYTDEEVRNLPKVASDHLHAKEWQLRKESCDRLIRYLDKKKRSLHILEIGCGNGWLSAQLAKNIAGQVVGMDINKEELTQASRVFKDISNLKFIPGDIRSTQPGPNNFDIIVFAASIQYFFSLEDVMQCAFQYLRAGGEVHILDSVFYKRNNVDAARQRTKDYYSGLGFPGAADYYYHHCIEDLERFPTRILYDPVSWRHMFKKNKNPFFWICINKPANQASNP